jgi:predicted dehydrogenase
MKILVIGCGAMGRRHLENAPRLGVTDRLAWDADPETRARMAAAGATAFETLEEALAQGPVAALICTPPSSHVALARQALAAGAHLFIERPICADLDGVEPLVEAAEAAQRVLFAGYNLRFHAGLAELLRRTHAGDVGRVRAVRAEMGGARALGNGVIMDHTEAIDYARGLVGEFDRGYAAAQRDGVVDPKTPEMAAIVLHTPSGVQVDLHLDTLPRRPAQSCHVVGQRGTLTWDLYRGLVHFDAPSGRETVESLRVDPNDMYLDELACFLDCVAGHRKSPVDGRTALRVLEIARSLSWSAGAKQEVEL